MPASGNGGGRAYEVHIFDPATGWTKKPGCYRNVGSVYDPANNTITPFSPPAPLQWYAAGVAAKGQFFVMGGSDFEPGVDGCATGYGYPTAEVRAFTP